MGSRLMKNVKHYGNVMNPYITGCSIAVLVIFSALAIPSMPNYAMGLYKLSESPYFKAIFTFLLVYTFQRDIKVALVSTLVLVALVSLLNYYKPELMDGSISASSESEAESAIAKTEGGMLVIQEAVKAVSEGLITHEGVEKIIKKIEDVERNGSSVLAAITNEGAKIMGEIAQAEINNLISEQEAKEMVAKVVVREEIALMEQINPLKLLGDIVLPSSEKSKQEISAQSDESMGAPLNSETLIISEVDNEERRKTLGSDQEYLPKATMAELAQEVMKRKQEETERKGSPLTSQELKELCSDVLDSRGGVMGEIRDNDDEFSSFASFNE